MYEGAYFIDRSGELFAPILEYLRTGELHIPENMSQLAVIREVQFYGIDLSQQTTFISGIPRTVHSDDFYRHLAARDPVLSYQGN